jgi:hypothetical protein
VQVGGALFGRLTTSTEKDNGMLLVFSWCHHHHASFTFTINMAPMVLHAE